jgi:uncharacterized protein YbjT (DUF2867 family)
MQGARTEQPPSALVAGATGLVGQEIVRQLAADGAWREVRALARRGLPPALQLPGVVVLPADFERLGAHPEWFRVDHVFCALGTTIRQAGSQPAFRRVDFDYALEVARLGRAEGARHFLLVSALGADARSRIFYNRVKGELEDAVRALGYPAVTIARPSLLLGQRTERRIGEELARLIGPFVPARWRPVHARQVAAALVNAARSGAGGVTMLENPALRAAGRDLAG